MCEWTCKKRKYVSSHVHLNLTYLLEVDENEKLQIKEDENSNVRWIPIEEIPKKVNEKWIEENIYHKLNEKLKISDEIVISKQQK